jgi:Fe-S cluster assembly ATP-binding protein
MQTGFEGMVINDIKLHERARLGFTLAWQEPVRFEGISVRDYLTLKNREINPFPYLEMVGLYPELYLNNVINELKKNGTSVLLITHREEVAKIADMASEICNGKIVCSGVPEKVAEYYKSRKCEVCADEVCVYV